MKHEKGLLILGCLFFIAANSASFAQGAKNDASGCMLPAYQSKNYKAAWVSLVHLKRWHPETEDWYFANHNLVYDALHSTAKPQKKLNDFYCVFTVNEDGSLVKKDWMGDDEATLKTLQQIRLTAPPKSLLDRYVAIKAENDKLTWTFDVRQEISCEN